jgi:hypothetical protein
MSSPFSLLYLRVPPPLELRRFPLLLVTPASYSYCTQINLPSPLISCRLLQIGCSQEGWIEDLVCIVPPYLSWPAWPLGPEAPKPTDNVQHIYHAVYVQVFRGNVTHFSHLKEGTLRRQSHLCIPFLGIARPQSQIPHSFFCERFMYIVPGSVHNHIFPAAK